MPNHKTDVIDPSIAPTRISRHTPAHLPLGFGGSWFVPYSAPSEEDTSLRSAIDTAYEGGVRHFDTASGYGGGHSEELYGAFFASHRKERPELFLASKADPADTSAIAMTAAIETSLRRLGVDYIDLYYIHWPRSGADMRSRMEALERAREAGKIRAVGVSNFSILQMRQLQQVGRIDAHQLGYNLLWRHAEENLIPFCIENGIAVVTYSSLAHGILTGKFSRTPELHADDQRHNILPFRKDIWPHVYAGVEQLKVVATEIDRPLAHLAIRWILSRPGISSVIVGARNRSQAQTTVSALCGEIPSQVLEQATKISDQITRHVPNEGNLFNYHP